MSKVATKVAKFNSELQVRGIGRVVLIVKDGMPVYRIIEQGNFCRDVFTYEAAEFVQTHYGMDLSAELSRMDF